MSYREIKFKKLLEMAKAEAMLSESVVNENDETVFIPTKTFELLQNSVIASGDLDHIVEFAGQNFVCSDVSALAQPVLESKDIEKNTTFASEVFGADVQAHGQVVIENGDSQDNYEFARLNLRGADILAHGKKIQEEGSAFWNVQYVKHIEGADIPSHRAVVAQVGKDSDLLEIDEVVRQIEEQVAGSNE